MVAPERAMAARLPSVVARPALFERLSAGYETGVMLISAPAGSGKTVLLRSWIDSAGLADLVAWVSVERDERDGQRFWLAVVEVLVRAAGAQGTIEDLGPSTQFDGEAVVERIIEGARSLEEPVLLVIDDLHHLLEPNALAQVERLLTHRPAQLRVILSTRHDPPIGLHRLRVNGELAELRGNDLRFGADDAGRLLAAANVTLSPETIGTLLARTEGWAAGLRLAALSLARNPDPVTFVAQFSGSERTVADYLFAEVLARQPESVLRLLLRTSILERVCGSLADRLLGTTGSEGLLLELEDGGAFVYSTDASRAWFRYHSLFGDLLQLELRRAEPALIPKLHHAAAEWFAEHELPIEAVRHAQAAEDWKLAAELLARHGFSLALDGSFATLRGLLERFPKNALDNPELAAFLAYGEVIRPSLESGQAYIALAERRAHEVPPERRALFQAMLTTAKLTLARWRGDYEAAIREVPPPLEPAATQGAGELAAENDVRAVALMTLGIVEVWAGATEDATLHLRDAADLAHRIDRPFVEQGSLAHLAIAAARHSVVTARDLALESLGILERYGWLSEPVVPLVMATLGAADALQGRFDDAEQWLTRAEQGLRPNAEPAKVILVRYGRGLQRIGQGRLGEAVSLLAEAHGLQSALVAADPVAVAAGALRAQVLARLGEPSAAREALGASTLRDRDVAETRIGLAAILLAEKDPRGALDALAPVRTGQVPAIVDFSLPNGYMLNAIAHELLGEAKAAEDDVEQALDAAEIDALILPFLITPAHELLERHPRHRTAHAALLSSILDVLAGAVPPARRGQPAALAEDLTDSEIRVLRYLPSNLSAPEIAAEVFLSTSTVKTHMRHVYEKLGVHKRAEAVERARELGLLGPSVRGRR